MPLEPIPCCVDVPDAFVGPARYALEALLQGLSARPEWHAPDALPSNGLYYGTRQASAAGHDLHWTCTSATLAFFADHLAYAPDRATWTEAAGHLTPTLFTLAEGAPDEVAATFFWLSGWQEHTVRVRDQHGRFPHHASLQAAWGKTDIPWVDLYRTRVGEALRSLGFRAQPRTWEGHPFAVCVTHDIDFLRKWRPGMIYREWVERALLNRQGERARHRLRRLRRFLSDWLTPGDVYRDGWHRMMETEARLEIPATHFLMAAARGPRDVGYRLGCRALRRGIERVRELGHELGLHPSYYASNHVDHFGDEVARLESVAGKKITSVRQHYLRWEMITPLLQVKINTDATLAFAEHEGFRHATSHPFRPWDHVRGRPHDVWCLPLAMMDTTLFRYRGLTVEEAIQRGLRLMGTVRQVGGVFVALWHNTVYDALDFPGQHAHFEDLLRAIADTDAAVLTVDNARRSYLAPPS